MNIGAQIFRNTCVIRERVATLKEKYFPESNQRAEFFPVEWRSNLVLDGGTVDAITPPHIKYLRQVLNTSAMDIMYYTSPIYCGEIQEGVADEMNRLYNMFCERNPHIKPKISVIAHSLGAVIVYDIVTGYLPQGFNTDGSFLPGKSRLNFELDKFFCLGSPLSVFLALRSKKGEHGYHLFPPSLCNRLYNVYHLTDPVAYRLEPLVLKDYCKIAPLPIHACNAAKPLPYSEMPLELEDITEGVLSTTPGSTLVSGGACAATATPSTALGECSSTTSPADTPCKDKGWSIWNTIWKNQKNQESGGSPHHMDSPSQGLEHRLDYVLTSGAAGPFVVRSVLVSHTAYWSNNDVAFFVLTRIFPELEDEICSEERYAKPNGRRKHKRRRGSSKGSWTRKRKFDATYRSFSKCVSQTKRRITRIWST
ncbi:hypothetical protein GE061_014970 [Apolygus lucorum]|uniref:DDHD domain-containing protein n=1 Tax=Apolygus lucorum TaxID=248454 RepID=A0A8S9XNR6_APOLU|nr:hypothetical protein GE061_014970 [Apolygus lucorum]